MEFYFAEVLQVMCHYSFYVSAFSGDNDGYISMITLPDECYIIFSYINGMMMSQHKCLYPSET